MGDRYLCSPRSLYHCNGMLRAFIRSECANAKHDRQIPRIAKTGLGVSVASCRNDVGILSSPFFLFSLTFALVYVAPIVRVMLRSVSANTGSIPSIGLSLYAGFPCFPFCLLFRVTGSLPVFNCFGLLLEFFLIDFRK